MLLLVLAFIFVAVVSSVITRLYLTTSQVGNLLIIEEDGEQPMMMLEIFQGHLSEIKPGKVVKLVVTQK